MAKNISPWAIVIMKYWFLEHLKFIRYNVNNCIRHNYSGIEIDCFENQFRKRCIQWYLNLWQEKLLLSIFLFLCFEYYSLLFIVVWFILARLEKTIWISWLDFLLFGPNYEVSFHGIRIFPVCIVFWLYFANSNQKKISLFLFLYLYHNDIQENQFKAAAFYIKYLLKF